MNEKTLVFVKPQNEDISQRIFDYLGGLLKSDLECYVRHQIKRIDKIPESLIAEHYRDLKRFDEEIFRNTIEAYTNGTIFLTYYTGPSIISRVRTKIGELDPLKSSSETIRGKFGKDCAEAAYREKRYLNNIIHASSSPGEAAREIDLWREYLID